MGIKGPENIGDELPDLEAGELDEASPEAQEAAAEADLDRYVEVRKEDLKGLQPPERWNDKLNRVVSGAALLFMGNIMAMESYAKSGVDWQDPKQWGGVALFMLGLGQFLKNMPQAPRANIRTRESDIKDLEEKQKELQREEGKVLGKKKDKK